MPWVPGVRPNSVPKTTSVSSSRPRCLRSLSSAGDRLVDLAAELAVVGFQAAVGVPGAGAAVGAVEDLHEAHAVLDQPPRGQALLAEGLGRLRGPGRTACASAAVSASQSTTSGTAVCMRKASS